VVPQVSLYTTGEPQGVPDAGRGCCAAGLSSLPLLSRPPSWGPAPWAETPSLYRVLARRVCLRARPSLIIPCV